MHYSILLKSYLLFIIFNKKIIFKQSTINFLNKLSYNKKGNIK